MAEKKRHTRGEGSIRQRKDGTWEARFVAGIEPGTGKEIRKSVYAKTQKEVRKKMTEAVAALDKDDYREPSKMTLAQWLEIWQKDYLGSVKPSTTYLYKKQINLHITPALGATKLEALNPHTIQQFYNKLGKGENSLAPKSIKNVHGILHKALQQAVKVGYIRSNPTDACTLPKVVRKELKPMDEDATAQFIEALRGHRYEILYLVTLFTGLRQGEVLGLMWDGIDFDGGIITVNKQLQRIRGSGGQYRIAPTKNSKGRNITPAPFVMELLRKQRRKQSEWRLKAGPAWEGDNLGNFVFTDELGHHLADHTVYRQFKKIVGSIDLQTVRFHDPRHPNVKPKTKTFLNSKRKYPGQPTNIDCPGHLAGRNNSY